MSKLTLHLKGKWFEMTKSGEKKEDYREITPYWIARLCHKLPYSVVDGGDFRDTHTNQQYKFKEFTHNVLILGYPSNCDKDRRLELPHAGIEIREGNPDWGAVPGKLYFVIKHGQEQTSSFFFTCGQKHSHDAGGGAIWNKDSVLQVNAYSEELAREFVFNTFGNKWAFCYAEGGFTPTYYPNGICKVYNL